MGWMGKSLGFDPALFELHGLAPQLAGYYACENGGSLDKFIHTMRLRFHTPATDRRRRTSSQHLALAQLDVGRIYTTNFDHHIEEAFREAGRSVDVLTTLDDFSRPTTAGACQVVKFHGDLDHPQTVVLSEQHFFDRLRLEAAPDQFLRADLLGNVFLFLGYSFSDTNIRYIWYRMHRLRREAGCLSPAIRSYWATFGTGLVQPRLLDDWQIDVIALDPRDKAKSVAELLKAIQ